jgi:hypothetical protein
VKVFEKDNPITITEVNGYMPAFFDNFKKYSQNFKNYDNGFFNPYVSGGFFAETFYTLVTYILVYLLSSFLRFSIIGVFVILLIEAIVLFRHRYHLTKQQKQNSTKVYHVGSSNAIITQEENVNTTPIPINVALPPPPPPQSTIASPLLTHHQIADIKKKSPTMRIDPNALNRLKMKTRIIPLTDQTSDVAPNDKLVIDENADSYNVNQKYVLSIIEKINTVITKNKFPLAFVRYTIMPTYSIIYYQAPSPSAAELTFKHKETYVRGVELEKIIIGVRDNQVSFEITNIKPFKVSMNVLDIIDHRLLGIDVNRKPIALDNEINSVCVFGRAGSLPKAEKYIPGSGSTMLLSNMIYSIIKKNDLAKTNLIIISPGDKPDTITQIYRELNIVNNNIAKGYDESIARIKQLAHMHVIDPSFYVVIENFNILLEKDPQNKDLLISLIKKINAKRGFIVMMAKTFIPDANMKEVVDHVNANIIFALSTLEQSNLLINSDLATKLNGNGDGYALVKDKVKVRFQTCYVDRLELNAYIDELNAKNQ